MTKNLDKFWIEQSNNVASVAKNWLVLDSYKATTIAINQEKKKDKTYIQSAPEVRNVCSIAVTTLYQRIVQLKVVWYHLAYIMECQGNFQFWAMTSWDVSFNGTVLFWFTILKNTFSSFRMYSLFIKKQTRDKSRNTKLCYPGSDVLFSCSANVSKFL